MLLNASRAEAVLAELQLDGLIATTRENLIYAADYERSLIFASSARAAAVVTASPARLAGLVVPRIEAGYLSERQELPDVLVLYGEFTLEHGPLDALSPRERAVLRLTEEVGIPADGFEAGLADCLRRLGLSRARLGWDDTRVGQALAAELPEIASRDGSEAWRWIRRVKTPEEIRRLRRSAEITEAVEAELITAATPGTRWRDIMERCNTLTVARGGVPGFWSSGPGHAGGFIYETVEHTLRPGDLVRYDFGCTYRHYWSDTGRTVSVGEPDAKAVGRYHALRTSMEETLGRVRPGVRFDHLFQVAMETAHRAGLPDYRRSHCGHSIGLQMYDGDYVAAGCSTVLEPGTALNLEMPYYELGWGGLQVEETVVVTQSGYEPLTNLSREIAANPC